MGCTLLGAGRKIIKTDMEESVTLSSVKLLWLGGGDEKITVEKKMGKLMKCLLLFHWS